MWIKVPCEFVVEEGENSLEKLQDLGIKINSNTKISWIVFNTKHIQNYNASSLGYTTIELTTGYRTVVLVDYLVFDKLFRPIDITSGLTVWKRILLKTLSYLRL
jgi:hypothetical protein